MTIQHVVTGTGAPSAVPPSVGAHYINTATGEQYLAKGTGSAADWVLQTAGMTKAEADGAYQPKGDYLTPAAADAAYQPKGDYATSQQLADGLAAKVDAVEGMGLSSNDFTTEEKNKLATVSAGSVETVTESRAVVVADNGGYLAASSEADLTLSIEAQSAAAWPAGAGFSVERAAAGEVMIAGKNGVSLRCMSGKELRISAQHGVAHAKRIGADTWTVFGDLADVVPAGPERLFVVYYDEAAAAYKAGIIDGETYGLTEVTGATGGLPKTIHQIAPDQVVWSPASGDDAYVADTSTAAVKTALAMGSGANWSAASPSTFLAFYQQGLAAFDLETGLDKPSALPDVMNRHAIFSPDYTVLYDFHEAGVDVRDGADLTVVLETNSLGVTVGYETGLKTPALSKDGSRVVGRLKTSGAATEVVAIFDTATWTLLHSAAAPEYPESNYMVGMLAIDPSNRWVAVAENTAGQPARTSAVIIDLDNGGVQLTLQPSADAGVDVGGGHTVNFSSDGSKLYLSTEGGIFIYNTADWSVITPTELLAYKQAVVRPLVS